MKRSLALGLLCVLALTGCTQTVPLTAADNAIDPACASVIVDISRNGPDVLGDGLGVRETDAQGTAAWGSPTGVILRCGVPEPLPTATLPCVEVDGIYWLADDSNSPDLVFTTYGRSPATEVIIDRDLITPAAALTELDGAVSLTEATRQCTEVTNTL